jgi:hypothetical protein
MTAMGVVSPCRLTYVANMVVRSPGARLAVLLSMAAAGFAAVLLWLATAPPAEAADRCELTARSIDCRYSGTTTVTEVVASSPKKFLALKYDWRVGECWYWTSLSPGARGVDPADEMWLYHSRWRLPQCPSRPSYDVVSRAWEVFRSFPLVAPSPRLRPTVGITNLPSVLSVARPTMVNHRETLPDGRVLEVQAFVDSVSVLWGDASRADFYAPANAFSGGATHKYHLKTCPPEYRASHPSGPNCHPLLSEYLVDVRFSWLGRYRTGGSWIVLGTQAKEATLPYDVDEVVGIPVAG